MHKPDLLTDVDKYNFEPSDFPKQLDKFIYGAIYNLYCGGAEEIHTIDIDNYLKENLRARELMENENGLQFLQDCEVYFDIKTFNYYYSKLKKLNLLRDLQKDGYDISPIYCEDNLDDDYIKKNDRFEKMKIEDIINYFKNNLDNLEKEYCIEHTVQESYAVDGIDELLTQLNESPSIGIKLQGDIFNTITRGARKGTLFLRSAGTGVGKSRLMVGDACQIAYPARYEPQFNQWISTGPCEKVLYIMTEQDPEEIQTMILAYLTGINEEVFKYGTMFFDPEFQQRVSKALEIMKEYKENFLFARMPEPRCETIKNLFRRHNLQKGVENFFFDYIFSTPALLNEYKEQGLQQYDCLRMLATTLKNLALELNAFVLTSTQVSDAENDKKDSWKDYHHIAGAKSIAHLVDMGCIVSRPTQEELRQLEGITRNLDITPNFVIDVFKNRGGRWTMLRIWSYHDLGTCRRRDLFVTTPNLKPIEDFNIIDFGMEKTQAETELEDRLNQYQPISEILNNYSNNYFCQTEEKISLTQEVEEAFGDFIQQRQRVQSKGFDDYL